MTERRYVLDASVGVKWFRDESGSAEARALFVRAAQGEVEICAPTHFVHEVLSVIRRDMSAAAVPEGWRHLKECGLEVVGLSDEVVDEAARQCELLDCSFYDALAPACAALLGATLASSDRRAHGGFPDVVIVE